jgi:hypothetical protein
MLTLHTWWHFVLDQARDEIEYAVEDKETTYFNDSCETARTAVKEATDAYAALCDKLRQGGCLALPGP